ncbi:MAG: outer membrane protein assembly factor BamB family protein, partial [Alphaproteobacteria bacterium]
MRNLRNNLSTAQNKPQPPAKRRLWLLMLCGLTAAMLAGLNVYGWRVEKRLSQIVQPAGQIPVVNLSATYGNYLLTTDRKNNLSLIANRQVERQKSFDAPIGAICADPTRGRILLGDNFGTVYQLDEQLNVHKTVKFSGRITGLAVLAGGKVAVCYGMGAYGLYHVSILDEHLRESADRKIATGFCTRLLTTDGTNAIYATVNSRVAMVSPEGKKLWQHTLDQRPLAIAATDGSSTSIAIADRNGRVTLLDGKGQSLWTRQVSRFALTQVAFTGDRQMILTSDRRGRIFIQNMRGQLLYGDGQLVRRPQLAAFAVVGEDLLGLSCDGPITRIALAEASSLSWVANFRIGRTAGNIVLAAALLTLMIVSSQFLSKHARRFLERLFAGRTAYLLLIPTFAMLGIFRYYPVITAFTYSLTNYSLNNPTEFVGLENFRMMLHDRYVWVGMKNMLIFLVTGLVKTLTVPLLAAELVFWLSGSRLKQFFRSAFVVPAVVPGLVFVLLWAKIYHPDTGLLNKILIAVGLERFTHAWLAEEGWALWSIVFAGFPWVSIFAFLVLLGGLININKN